MWSGAHRAPHSFPTRRSSDLDQDLSPAMSRHIKQLKSEIDQGIRRLIREGVHDGSIAPCDPKLAARSEEHTSELQSHHDLVCRPLLEKKIESKAGRPPVTPVP